MNLMDTENPTGVTDSTDTDGPGSLLATVRGVTNEIVRLLQDTASKATDGWSLPALARAVAPEIEATWRERDTLRTEVAVLCAERLSLEAGLQESGRARSSLEATLAEAQQRVAALQAEVDAAGARELRLREDLTTVTTRAASEREETLRLGQQMTAAADAARAAVATELESTREALAALQTARLHAETDVTDREVELDRARRTIVTLEAARDEATAATDALRTRQAELDAALASARQEVRDVQTKLRDLASAHEEVLKDRVRLRQDLDEATERERQLSARVRDLEVPPVPTGATIDAALLERAREHERSLETDLAAASATASAATARLELLQSELAAAVDVAARREQEGHALAAEKDCLAAALASMKARILDLERERDEARAAVPAVVVPVETPEAIVEETVDPEPATDPEPLMTLETFAVAHAPVEADVSVATVESFVVATDDPVIETAVASDAPAPAIDHLAILDVRAWDAQGHVTLDTVPMEADADAEQDTAPEIAAPVCLLNLACAQAIATAARLREAGNTTPLWACAIADDAIVGLGLGSYEVLPRPLEPERVHQQLQGRVPAGATVVVVRSDGATLLALRQGLLQSGHSVRTAWTLPQAAELTQSIRAAVVVMDLAQEPARAAELCVELSRRDTPPLVVLLPGSPAQLEEFTSALGRFAGNEGTLDRAAIVARACRG